MLSRLLPKPSNFRLLSHLPFKSQPYTISPNNPNYFNLLLSPFSTNNDSNGKDHSTPNPWNLSNESNSKFDSFFTHDSTNDPAELSDSSPAGDESWLRSEEDLKPWNLDEDEGEKKVNLFDIGEGAQDFDEAISENSVREAEEESKRREEENELEKEEEKLTAILKGPNRAFGDLMAASGITDEMLDSLIALKDFEGIEGLPPLRDIEDMRYEKNTRKSTRAEIEQQKQEEIAKARVRQVDDKGRAYGTGRRKCSVARVWIQPGDGKFMVNDKQFDVYFPMLDHRAALLRPFSETKTLGLWDINCTVKGGGVSGQVGAIRLGISRALQNWEPDLRPALRSAGFLTRDSRVVERKKPGKAKARKSYQWVKR